MFFRVEYMGHKFISTQNSVFWLSDYQRCNKLTDLL